MMQHEICLRGLLIPKDWHGNGRVKIVALATDDEREITLRNPPRKNIIHHLRHQVELWGAFDDPQDPTVFQISRLRSLNAPT
jgi:hypothetical protein